ncbi:TPA_asm: DNA-directed RNA polymerase subunit beta' [Campylobacter jejuni]|nr:DNA-directed RNA polymerase subunit beta' [Campylobacter jejuni]
MQNNIKIYNQNPENINQKLNENMVFELADNEAKEVKKIISFEKIHNLRKKLQKWNANYLTSFSKTELTNPQEFIPLLSIYYQRPARFNPESGLILLQKVLKDKNRFLVWFSVRYYADIRQFKNPYYSRRIQESNFREANTKQGLKLPDKYTYLSFMQTYKKCKEVDEKTEHLLREYNTYYTKDKHYYSYVAKEEFQSIADILAPYLNYLNTLTQKNFSLDNIYCIANYCENLGANKLDNVALLNKTLRQKFEKLEANTPHNILILYPNPTPSIIQIEQPKNTFITLLIGAKAKIDCTKLIEDQCELMYLKYDPTQEEQQTSNPQAFSCSTQEELI